MKKTTVVISVVSIIIGVLIGKLLPSSNNNSKLAVKQDNSLKEVRESGYKFISPLLECETGNDYYKLNGLNSLQAEVSDLVDAWKNTGQITNGAVYFRELNNGPWFGVNEHNTFSPASLLKLPVMMAYYKKAENDPQLLTKKVKYTGADVLLGQDIAPTNSIVKGKEYTIEDLVERMVIYSDNAALTVLEDNIEPGLIDKVTIDLGVETAKDTTPVDFMSVKGYAGLFRILYNASYLEKNDSEKTLEILSKVQFDGGLVAGVPKGITVSHKFGERQLEANLVQLHDCGIIYNPHNPYLLCVMTSGKNFSNLEQFIAKVSSITFNGIEARVRN